MTILKFQTIKGHAGDVRAIGYMAAGAGHEQPTFTNMAGSNVGELMREVAALRSLRPKLNKAGAHLILAHDKNQKSLSEDEWRESLEIALAEHRALDAPYAAWLHDDGQHLHVFLLRIRSDGSVVNDSNSYRSNERAARAIEAHLGLDPPKPREPSDRHPHANGARAERGRRRFERLFATQNHPDQPPQKGPLKMINPSLIFAAIEEAIDLADLKKRLTQKGIEVDFTQAPGAAEPTGWSLRAGGASGTWLKGSDVDRALSLMRVKKRIEARRLERLILQFRELLGDLLDDLDRNEDFQDKIEQDEDQRQRLGRSQISLLGALLQIPLEVMRRLIAAVVNAIAAFLERLYGLPQNSLGRIEIDQGGQPQSVAPAASAPGSTAQQIDKLTAAQRILSAALAQIVAAIREGDPSLLPGSAVVDAQVKAARQAVIDKVREIEGDDDEDSDQTQYEPERQK